MAEMLHADWLFTGLEKVILPAQKFILPAQEIHLARSLNCKNTVQKFSKRS
jgi:hypothetical protein